MEKDKAQSVCDFKMFKRFHYFYYSKKDNQTFFLLVKKKSTGLLSEIRGKVNDLDPGVLFSAARKAMQISAGFLSKSNLIQFSQTSCDIEVNRETLNLCKPTLDIPQMMNQKPYQTFIEDTFLSSIPYQNQTDDAYYFVEFPYIDTTKLNNYCADCKVQLEVAYKTRQEIISDDGTTIDPKLGRLFDDDLTTFVEKYIENGEPIPIKAHYAVLVIYTTPTNYRVMGILGSNFKKFGEQWKVYKYPLEQPTEQEISQWNGIILTCFI